MMKKRVLLALSAAMLALGTGCTDLQYVGPQLEELPEGTPVIFTWEKSEIDPTQYMIIGHGLLTVSHRKDRYDIEDILTEEARKHGADAVCVVGTRRVNAGFYDLDEDEMFFSQGVTDSVVDPALKHPRPVSPEEDAKWGQKVKLQGEYHGRNEIKVRAVFWKKRSEAEPLIRQQKELLEHKAAGNWNGENVPEVPKRDPAPEKFPAPEDPVLSAQPIPIVTQEPAMQPKNLQTPSAASPVDPQNPQQGPAAPLMEELTSPETPHLALPPSGIVAMP